MKKMNRTAKLLMIIFFSAIAPLSSMISGVEAGGGSKDYYCEFKDGYYETKYEKTSKIPDEIEDNPGSYTGKCELTVADQSSEAQGTRLALCHYVNSTTWYQIYVDFTGYRETFWCEKKGATYETKLDERSEIAEEIADDPGSYTGACTGETAPTVYCRYKDNEWETKDEDTYAQAVSKVNQYPGSHLGGCTYHEWHMDSWGNDYWGHCTQGAPVLGGGVGTPYDSYIAPAPSTLSAGEKKLGPGIGAGPVGKRGYKPRTGFKSLK